MVWNRVVDGERMEAGWVVKNVDDGAGEEVVMTTGRGNGEGTPSCMSEGWVDGCD